MTGTFSPVDRKRDPVPPRRVGSWMGWISALLVTILGVTIVIMHVKPAATSIPTATAARDLPLVPRTTIMDEYVGSHPCAACHREIVETYRHHPMAESVTDLRSPNAVPARRVNDGQGPLILHRSPFEFVVDFVAGRMLHHEILRDSTGEVLYDQTAEVRYALGSGARGQSFVIDRGGVLQQSPISWYAKDGQWDLSPGYVAGRDTQFERRIGDECLHCHAGQVASSDASPPNIYADPPLVELGISCERCHGPGRKHIAIHTELSVATARADPIVNPAKLSTERRNAVCYQCHLSANRVLRFGRRPADFRPGEKLSDNWAVFVRRGQTDAEGAQTIRRAVSHVEEMQASRCFLASQSGPHPLSCVSCHDPHGVPGPEDVIAHYRARCTKCHDETECKLPTVARTESPRGDSCFHCHMPRRTTADIAHTTQTSHWIVRRSTDALPAPTEIASPDSDPDDLIFFDSMDRDLPSWESQRTHGIALAKEGFRRQDRALLLAATGKLSTHVDQYRNDAEALATLGEIHHALGDDSRARRYLERAVSIDSQHEAALKLLGIICFRAGDYNVGIRNLGQFLAINPFESDLLGRQADMHSAFRQYPLAMSLAERALALNPKLTHLRRHLAETYQQFGNLRQAEQQRQLADRIDARLKSASIGVGIGKSQDP